jgi:DeoR/GlpR family transcriptional regulator of sugar metabolism
MSVSIRQRRERILNGIYEKGHVTVDSLVEAFSVSPATVRRDLRFLAAGHPIEVVYGGAALVRSADFSFRSKAMRNVEAKKIIGRLAAEIVADGDTIFLDSGTTCFEMAPFLKRRRGLSIIVNSARLAMELDTPGLSVILIGGKYRPERMDTIGPVANNTLDMLRGYRAFVGSDGLSMEFGLTAGDIESAELYRLAVRNARETTLVADQSKFASPSLFKIVDFSAVSRVVTDSQPPADWLEFLASHNIETVFPKPAPSGEGAPEDTARG